MKNDVWEVVPRPEEKSIVTSKWLYKIKHGSDGSAEKYKARFVARGFSQKEAYILMIYLHMSSVIPPFHLLLPSLQRKNGVSIRWM